MIYYILSLGANTGDPEKNLALACEALSNYGAIKKRTPVERTRPWGIEDQPDFFNMLIGYSTALSPFELGARIFRTETLIGRVKTKRWGPREIDIDILLCGELILNSCGLIIPHPFLHRREFILKPLKKYFPDAVHPVFKKRIEEL